MVYTYHITARRQVIEDVGAVTTYGIALDDNRFVADISEDREAVETLCRQLCDANLSPLHLRDVIYDWLVNNNLIR